MKILLCFLIAFAVMPVPFAAEAGEAPAEIVGELVLDQDQGILDNEILTNYMMKGNSPATGDADLANQVTNLETKTSRHGFIRVVRSSIKPIIKLPKILGRVFDCSGTCLEGDAVGARRSPSLASKVIR